jgi:hypothetical protein
VVGCEGVDVQLAAASSLSSIGDEFARDGFRVALEGWGARRMAFET